MNRAGESNQLRVAAGPEEIVQTAFVNVKIKCGHIQRASQRCCALSSEKK